MSARRSATILVEMLQNSLGPQVAHERVLRAIHELRLDHSSLSEDEAMRVLEKLASEKGLVGLSARFVKARLVLVWAQG